MVRDGKVVDRADVEWRSALMYRLGLRLTLRSGREALVRLLVTAAAVAVGVAIMLAVLADFHAFQVTNNRPSWESTQGRPVTPGYAIPAACRAVELQQRHLPGPDHRATRRRRASGRARRSRRASPGCPAAGSTTPRPPWRR